MFNELLKESYLILFLFDVVRNEFLFAEHIFKNSVLLNGLARMDTSEINQYKDQLIN